MKLLILTITFGVCLALPEDVVNKDQGQNQFKPNSIKDEEKAKEFLKNYNDEYSKVLNDYTKAEWNYNTNISDETSQKQLEASTKLSEFSNTQLALVAQFDQTDFSEDTKRQLKLVGSKSLPEDEEKELTSIISQMGKIYSSSKICLDEDQEDACLTLAPGLKKIMSGSDDYYKRTFVWKAWRNKIGRELKPKYERYVELKNKRAQLNDFKDAGHEWRQSYDSETFEDEMLQIYSEMKPLYKELHAFVRRKLYDVYGEKHIDLEGHLPASVLGDMWGRFWADLYKHLVPYPDKPDIDPSEEMKKQNYTVEKMFHTANDFYVSMGLKPVPESFWKLSMLRKPEGRDVVCHATAWDFFDGKDVRIKMCTADYSFGHLNTIHHELGHTQYHMQYSHQPVVFRDGANGGFHEAIGELMAMAGATPKHLYSIGLMKELVEDEELDINFLMSQALITISTLPFHLVNDLWRWKVFRGEIPKENWNKEFWKLKEEMVGVKSPVERTQDDLDPPTLFHICQDYDMIRYFTRTILQFQFAEKLCEISGHTGPLHRCDFSQSKEAGAALAEMLQLGSSKPWQDALETLTGERQMSAKSILKFFDPLYQWLKKKNQENGDKVGWM